MSGFVHHADSPEMGISSDAACSARCSARETCTAWVRQPSSNKCSLSTQVGTIAWGRLNVIDGLPGDGNGGLKCHLGMPLPPVPIFTIQM